MKVQVVAMKFIFNFLLLIGMIFAIGLGEPDTLTDTSPDNVPIGFAVADVKQNVSDASLFIAVNDVGKQNEEDTNYNLYNSQSETLPGINADYNLPISPGWQEYYLQ